MPGADLCRRHLSLSARGARGDVAEKRGFDALLLYVHILQHFAGSSPIWIGHMGGPDCWKPAWPSNRVRPPENICASPRMRSAQAPSGEASPFRRHREGGLHLEQRAGVVQGRHGRRAPIGLSCERFPAWRDVGKPQ